MLFVALLFTHHSLAQPTSKAQPFVPNGEVKFDRSNRYDRLGVMLDRWSEAQVRFWVKAFTDYGTRDGILHDSLNLQVVYRVIPPNAKLVEEEKVHLGEVLKLSDPEKSRIRMQLGQRDRLEHAFAISTRYLKRMEEMFEEEGVPKELTRLPFVESGFVSNARSSVGAIGIWQFMPKTAMKDLRVDSIIDERLDPLKSTRAAARFLKSNFNQLKNWSLAVMAYHHGPALVKKAVGELKTDDPITVIKNFKDPNFKFASRNYLFELLAMLDVDAMHALFFKDIDAKPLPPFITVSFQKKMSVPEIIQQFKLSVDEIKVLNPHFLKPLWGGHELLPAHYPVRLSGISLDEFRKANYD